MYLNTSFLLRHKSRLTLQPVHMPYASNLSLCTVDPVTKYPSRYVRSKRITAPKFAFRRLRVCRQDHFPFSGKFNCTCTTTGTRIGHRNVSQRDLDHQLRLPQKKSQRMSLYGLSSRMTINQRISSQLQPHSCCQIVRCVTAHGSL